jgi:hypothetical protein
MPDPLFSSDLVSEKSQPRNGAREIFITAAAEITRRVDRAPLLVLAPAMMLVLPKPLVGVLVPDPMRF